MELLIMYFGKDGAEAVVACYKVLFCKG